MLTLALVPRSPEKVNKQGEAVKGTQARILLGILKAQPAPCRLPAATLWAGKAAQGRK